VKKIFFALLLVLILFALASCNNTTEETPTLSVPTPNPDFGVVIGKIISISQNKPPEANLFLSKNITEGRTDVPPVFSFSFQTNPRGVMDKNGNFYFQDVPAGTYAITLWTPPGDANFVKNTAGDDYIWVVVEMGKVTDLGEIKIP